MTKQQIATLDALRQPGTELVEQWGIDRGATGLCCRGFYFAWLQRQTGKGGALTSGKTRIGKPLRRATVNAIREHLAVTYRDVSRDDGMRISVAVV